MVGKLVDGALLRLDDCLILDEDLRVSLAQLGRARLIAKLVVAHQRPEIHAGRMSLRSDRVQHPAVDALRAIAVRCSSPGRRDPDIEYDRAGGFETDNLPT